MPRDRFLKQSLGSLYSNIQKSRILVVGAGGIGCELLKNVVCTGFGEIHVVDLDTIDLSNLNRQFLFRQSHIKKSKAIVAQEAASHFNPNVQIKAHHANIKDPQFNVEWFNTFAIVFNALDNLDARRHVNKMCLAADVPLIESGTTGFNGQVQPISKGKTECYDCQVKETPKSFPVCTIRSTPSQPIHCIVWAKSYLFSELFGISEDAAPDLDHTEDEDNADEIQNLRQEAAALKEIRMAIGSEEFPRKVFEKVYAQDIGRLRSMEDMWMMRKPPTALNFDQWLPEAANVASDISMQDQKTWSLAENIAVFSASLNRLSNRLEELKANADTGNAPPILTFDKDDKDTLDFVASAANLRSIVFGIETRSEFDIKQMAGNIIPAIATTNANTAALCVLEAFKIMQKNLKKAKMVFLVKSTDRMISNEPLRPPKPDCGVCGNAQASLIVNAEKATIEDIVDRLLKAKLGYTDELSITTDEGIIYDPDMEENLSKTLSELGIKGDTFITVRDEEDENTKVNLVLAISEAYVVTSLPFHFMPQADTSQIKCCT
ncbi:ThiF family protein [Delphinella strobiligena]|nr:ThiF family protein [Delphinella strobiligena]